MPRFLEHGQTIRRDTRAWPPRDAVGEAVPSGTTGKILSEGVN